MPLDLSPHDLLRWYLDAGIDETIGETALDRYALSAKPAAPAAIPQSSQPARAAPLAVPAVHRPAVMGAGAAHAAAECATLEDLRLAMENFDSLPLKRTALSTVFADGSPDADIMCIGEAPGHEEDQRGLPFVGRSGKLLDRMLASIGLSRESVYITNVVPWRPVDNRKPTHEEVAACLPFVARHIELVDPKILILFGGAAASALLARAEGINRLRGRWYDYSSPKLPRPIPVMPTFHPAYLLRTPAAKRDAWRDLLMVKSKLGLQS